MRIFCFFLTMFSGERGSFISLNIIFLKPFKYETVKFSLLKNKITFIWYYPANIQNMRSAVNITPLIVSMNSIKNSTPKRPSFFLIHPIGGTVFCYFPLVRSLTAQYDFYGIRSSGFQKDEAIFCSVEEMAQSYISQIKEIQKEGPYSLGGWSFGGILAFEIASQFAKEGKKVKNLLIIDSFIPSIADMCVVNESKFIFLFFKEMLISSLEDERDKFLDHPENFTELEHAIKIAIKYGLLPQQINLHEIRNLYETFKNNFNAYIKYRPKNHYEETINFFWASDNKSLLQEALKWQPYVNKEKIKNTHLSGDHNSIFQKPNLLENTKKIDSNIVV